MRYRVNHSYGDRCIVKPTACPFNYVPQDLAKGQQDYCRNCGRARPKIELDSTNGFCQKCNKVEWNGKK